MTSPTSPFPDSPPIEPGSNGQAAWRQKTMPLDDLARYLAHNLSAEE